MPNRDGTGPNGEGPRTGRGLGNCKSDNKVAVDRRPLRTGRGRGRRIAK